jgi:hypothetical protein
VRVIDSNAPIDEVSERIRKAVENRLF